MREAVVELAANAAAFFILELEELGGELVDGALGVFHFGDVGERADDADDVAVGVELRDGVAIDPKDAVRTGAMETNEATVNRSASAENVRNRVIGEGDGFAVFGDGRDAQIEKAPADGGAFRNIEHAVSGPIGEFDA